MSKDTDFCHWQEICLTNTEKNYWIQLKETGLDTAKTASKKVVHKTVKPTRELVGDKTAGKIL